VPREPDSDPASAPEAARLARAFDAVANRAAEAVRVIEDVFRFVHDDRLLAAETRQIRHDLAAAVHEVDRSIAGGLRLARDVGGDVGTDLPVAGSLRRETAADVLSASAARAGQALRSLSELVVLLQPGPAGEAAPARFDGLRYRLYAVAGAAARLGQARERLDGIDLCVLVATGEDEDAFLRLVEGLYEAGVRFLQLRDPVVTAAVLYRRARVAVAAARRRGGLLVVNDRPDVALAAGADGAHVGQTDLPTEAARQVLGPTRLLGRTVHSPEELRQAVAAGPDYLGVGPCFGSPTKRSLRPADRGLLEALATATALPTFAIGGVTLDRIGELAAMGFSRIAVASAVTAADDPAAAAAALLDRLAAERACRSRSTTAEAIAGSSLDR
jgi:thiamine-phosphate pyrophosphorylase